MQVLISLNAPPNHNLVKFKMNVQKLSALLTLISNALEAYKNSGLWPGDLDASSTEPDFFERLDQTLTSKLARQFKKILKEHHLSEKAVCKKYGADCINDLTGSDALDVIVKDILPKMKRKQKRSENE